jgi:murein DD-endopeptidase MepM/ murein hydrolase activator NlpD
MVRALLRRVAAGAGVAVAVWLAGGCGANDATVPASSEPGASSGMASLRSSAIATASPAATASARLGVRYTFPVQPLRHVSFGRTHHDYPATDIFARCGDSYLAATSGVVLDVSRVDRWDPDHDNGATRGGLSVTIRGDDGVRYYGSHLREVAARVRAGMRIDSGDVVGMVGRSGNARSTACHVHFGISPTCPLTGDWWTRRGVVSPWPYLMSWRGGGQRSPAGAVALWYRRHGCPRALDPMTAEGSR